ncbi:dipeptide ABC transporter ATP-binding protein [Aggregatilinea lenta]|uniref:dipeptide ABC transporter ATP-binding protein n=1 Tax=Aggregatilinea lenta TaxID=913108 RepID=UPI000E5B6F7A|nr:ABC transporter ATP-binding protein [Aggregatilinea lenta]
MAHYNGSDPVLRVENLSISYKVGRRWIGAVRGFQVEVRPGQIYGIVGESGSGKSTAAAGIMRYLPANGRIGPDSRVEFMGEDLAPKSRRTMESIWGAQMGLVPQDPAGALNPSIRVGEQVAEILRRHAGMDRAAARERTVEMFRRAQLADPETLLGRYPHELSGGMQQRVLIAMALATSPRLLILDEPTTALDVTTEAVILDLVRNLIAAEGAGAIYVTHNLGVVAQLCERVAVLYAGEVMEDATVAELFTAPRHPYTIGLLNSIPRLGQTKRDAALQAIAGRPPSLAELPQGCVYAPRCPLAIEICRTKPPLEAPAEGRLVRCHRWQEIASSEISVRERAEAGIDDAAPVAGDREPLLEVTELTKHFEIRSSLMDTLRGEHPAPVRAVDGVNLGIQKGRTLGLVGESGSGKTTLARVVIGLTDRTSGEIELMGIDVPGTVRERDKTILAQIQMVFQNPQNSLNPYLTVGQALRRPLLKLAKVRQDAVDAEIRRLLTEVNLRPEYADRYPGELSGGEKQRVAIARAFASNPALILCDEPISSLDVSVQAAVLNLLARLQAEHDTSYLFISHDLAVVGYLADYLVVMYLGVIYEVGYGSDLFRPPYHPYTEALVSAIPRPNPDAQPARVRLSGDIPSPRDIPTGCRFHTRCPHKVGEICEHEEPPWRDDGSGHFIRCHRELWDLAERQQATRIEEEG